MQKYYVNQIDIALKKILLPNNDINIKALFYIDKSSRKDEIISTITSNKTTKMLR